ncbi:MAG: sugar ABC transporter ATP-binding protein [Trueperaceae bacterium]|nr:sugar ABC transporter ATP-binding protein [Trueperaceae bacterium]
MMTGSATLSLQNIYKSYPGVTALKQVDFSIAPGEVRALLGKNGAGKSTLIRIACGLEKPDRGSVLIRGQQVDLKSPAEAKRLGIEMVSQELNLVPWLSVAENISLGNWPKRRMGINYKAMRDYAAESLARLQVDLPPDLPLFRLSPAQQQLVEIAKAIARQPSVLFLDEPTSSLAATEVASLLATVKHIAAQGVGVIYVSHRLAEIAKVADSATILRNGNLISTAPLHTLSEQAIVMQMVGEAVQNLEIESKEVTSKPVVLEVSKMTVKSRIKNVSFKLHGGEVLGLAGLLGTGRSEILRAIAGFEAPDEGEIKLASEGTYRANIRHMLAKGVALSPEDRRVEGIVPFLGVDENLMVGRWRDVTKAGNISWRSVSRIAKDLIKRLAIKTPKQDTPVMNLSGGNQQKVVIGRWLDVADRVLLLDEPTRGVDVEAKNQIYEIIRSAAARGVGVVVVTSELEELFWCCDSVIFLRNGEASRKYPISSLDLESLNLLATGTLQS